MRKNLAIALSLVFILGMSIYFRSFPINFPQFKEDAKFLVNEEIHNNISLEIEKRFPDFSVYAKDTLVKTAVGDFKKSQKKNIEARISKKYSELKSKYQDEHGQTFLMELDCWHWARYVENIVTLGHPGDKVINGKQFDSLMLAPNGDFLPWSQFLLYLSAFLYKCFNAIAPVSLMAFLFYLPLLFLAIFLITLYFFSRRYCGDLGAVVCCVFIGLNQGFIIRSCVGWFDTDVLNVFFPLVIIWLYFAAHHAATLKSRIISSLFCAFCLGIFSFTWIYWWYILAIIAIYELFSLGNLVSASIQYKEDNRALLKKRIFTIFPFLIFSFFWVIIFSGSNPFNVLFLQIKKSLQMNNSFLEFSIWPNTLAFVSELKKAPLEKIISLCGGIYLFVLILACMLLLFLYYRHNGKLSADKRDFITLLVFWFFSMLFAAFKGLRFTIFLIIPMGIILGWAINQALEYFKSKKKALDVYTVYILVLVIVCALVIKADGTAKKIYPFVNKAWYNTLVKIKQTTPGDIVINSWWDFGDCFKAIAKRKVIFDGQTQQYPQSYWMARVLISRNEKEALKILRMLNNGGNKAFEIINTHFNDPLRAVIFLNKIISVDEKSGRELLKEALPGQEAGKVSSIIFDKPRPAYFVVDYSMLDKMHAYSYLGNWDFLKACLAKNLNKKNETENYLVKLGIDKPLVSRLADELGLIQGADLDKWVTKMSLFHGRINRGREDSGMVYFNNGSVYDLKGARFHLYSEEARKFFVPKSTFIFEDSVLSEVKYPDSDLDYSALVYASDGQYELILLDDGLADSLLAKLYLFNGKGCKNFKPFIEERTKEGCIRVFEIIWD